MRVTRLLHIAMLVAACPVLQGGCGSELRDTPEERVGKIYYLDGAGNYGFGQGTVPEGLRSAGYRGDIEVYNWTSVLGGAFLDQMLIFHAKAQGDALAKRIDAYLDRYPDKEVNVIALSAGTGVACWAAGKLAPEHKINNMVLLGSSLSKTFQEMPEALEHVKGKVYVYHSPSDPVLSVLVRFAGTIDRQFTECAGEVGLEPPAGAAPSVRSLYRRKVQNIPYQASFKALGYIGDHTSCTTAAFVRGQIAPRILTHKDRVPPRDATSASQAR